MLLKGVVGFEELQLCIISPGQSVDLSTSRSRTPLIDKKSALTPIIVHRKCNIGVGHGSRIRSPFLFSLKRLSTALRQWCDPGDPEINQYFAKLLDMPWF